MTAQQKYDVWEQEAPGSDWFVPICKKVSLRFALWSIQPGNKPEGLERYYTKHHPYLKRRSLGKESKCEHSTPI